ncbi:hypothetical protein ANO11243_046340 [Dothideomycetidae sp. 11243]|nr:hypothetical protein ANO11243_046340 [fungal sp. No.11243]
MRRYVYGETTGGVQSYERAQRKRRSSSSSGCSGGGGGGGFGDRRSVAAANRLQSSPIFRGLSHAPRTRNDIYSNCAIQCSKPAAQTIARGCGDCGPRHMDGHVWRGGRRRWEETDPPVLDSWSLGLSGFWTLTTRPLDRQPPAFGGASKRSTMAWRQGCATSSRFSHPQKT